MSDSSSPIEGRITPQRLLESHLARPLLRIAARGLSGVMTIDEGSVTTRLHVTDGVVVYAERGPLAETLGRRLVREGVLDRDEYLLILERMGEPSDRDEVQRFGEVALSLGMLEAQQLHEALAAQVEGKLVRCLQLDEGQWRWTQRSGSWDGPSFRTRVEPTVRRALREDPLVERWAGLWLRLRLHTALLRGEPDEIASRFGAPPAELRFLRSASGQSIGALLTSELLEAEQVGALLSALSFGEALELRSPSHAEALRREQEQSVRPPPMRFARPVEPASEAETRAHEAAERLREEMKRRGGVAPVTTRGRLDAERAFERGRELLLRGHTAAAKESFDLAAELLPDAAEYVLHQRYCAYLTETDAARKPTRRQELQGAALEALRQDRELAFAHYVQGRLLFEDEDLEKAERSFRVARRLAPELVEAERYLRLLRSRRGR